MEIAVSEAWERFKKHAGRAPMPAELRDLLAGREVCNLILIKNEPVEMDFSAEAIAILSDTRC